MLPVATASGETGSSPKKNAITSESSRKKHAQRT